MEPLPTPLSEAVLRSRVICRRKTAPKKVLANYNDCGTSGGNFNLTVLENLVSITKLNFSQYHNYSDMQVSTRMSTRNFSS